MTKKKIVELVLSAVSTLIDAAKAVLRFIGSIGKLKKKSKTCYC